MNELEYAIDTVDGTPFEKLANDFLRVKGYEVHESGIEGKDGGWDARIEIGDQKGIAHASVRNDWRRKIREDADKVHKLENNLGESYDLFVFVTNQGVTGKQELELVQELETEYGWRVQIHHRQNILGEIRTNKTGLADEHLGVDLDSERDHLEQVCDLRDDRIDMVRNRDEIAQDLEDGATVLLHVIPNGVFSNERKRFTENLPNPPVLWESMMYPPEVHGKAVVAMTPELGTPWEAYGQIRNDGLFESATTTGIFDGMDGKFLRFSAVPGNLGFDAATIITVRRALSALEELGFSGTATVSVSLLDAAGTVLPERERGYRHSGIPKELKTDVYSTEPVAVTIGSENVIGDLEPAISEVWREFGKEDGTENIEDGKWVGGRVSINHDTLLKPAEESE